MNTTVLTVDPVDYGAGPNRKQTFVGCKWHVDDAGTLHVVRQAGGNCAAFARGMWRMVTDGSAVVTAEARR